MEKVKITLVVPERIAALVQIFLQRNAFGDSNNLFHQYLESHGVENPQDFSKEMEIGIEHPDDEPIKIASYSAQECENVHYWLSNKSCASYMDLVLNEDLFSIMCLDEINVDPPQYVIDFVESVKATDCSYFRFVNS